MKRVLLYVVPILVLLISACGGDDDTAPPPAVPGTDPQSLAALQCVAEGAKQVCCSEYSAMFAYCVAVTTAPPPAPGTSGWATPTTPVPPPPQPTPMIPTLPPGCAPQTAPLTCEQWTTNFEIQFKATYGVSPPPEAMSWRYAQGVAVVECTGQANGITSADPSTIAPYTNAINMCVANMGQVPAGAPTGYGGTGTTSGTPPPPPAPVPPGVPTTPAPTGGTTPTGAIPPPVPPAPPAVPPTGMVGAQVVNLNTAEYEP